MFSFSSLEKIRSGAGSEEIIKKAQGVDQGNKLSVNSNTMTVSRKCRWVGHPLCYSGAPYRG